MGVASRAQTPRPPGRASDTRRSLIGFILFRFIAILLSVNFSANIVSYFHKSKYEFNFIYAEMNFIQYWCCE